MTYQSNLLKRRAKITIIDGEHVNISAPRPSCGGPIRNYRDIAQRVSIDVGGLNLNNRYDVIILIF